MQTETPPRPNPVDWRRLHALGLPSGSIRALLAIVIFATAWGLLVHQPELELPDYLRDLLFIIMGHYFATRKRASNEVEVGPPPLFLPRGTIRLLLVLGTIATAVVLFRNGQLTKPDNNPGVVTLLLVGGFLFGVGLNWVYSKWKERGHQAPRGFEDCRAILSVTAASLLVLLVVNRLVQVVPQHQVDGLFSQWLHFGKYGPEHLLAAFVGFYFGSRS